jgi:hypothetical protein
MLRRAKSLSESPARGNPALRASTVAPAKPLRIFAARALGVLTLWSTTGAVAS